MKKLTVFGISIFLIALTGCDKKYSVSEMVKDSELRQKVLQKCDEGKYEPMGANCINAQKATIIHQQRLYNATISSVVLK